MYDVIDMRWRNLIGSLDRNFISGKKSAVVLELGLLFYSLNNFVRRLCWLYIDSGPIALATVVV